MAARIVESIVLVAGAAVMMSACQAPPPRELSGGHVSGRAPAEPSRIPPPVRRAPYVPSPAPRTAEETYTVVVHEVPVRELLFVLARDASINADVHPLMEGLVTLNAIDQTLD